MGVIVKAKSILAGITAAALLVSAANGATTPLPAGKPAGTKNAAFLLALGLPALLGLGAATIAIIAAAGGFDNSTTTTTGTGS